MVGPLRYIERFCFVTCVMRADFFRDIDGNREREKTSTDGFVLYCRFPPSSCGKSTTEILKDIYLFLFPVCGTPSAPAEILPPHATARIIIVISTANETTVTPWGACEYDICR